MTTGIQWVELSTEDLRHALTELGVCTEEILTPEPDLLTPEQKQLLALGNAKWGRLSHRLYTGCLWGYPYGPNYDGTVLRVQFELGIVVDVELESGFVLSKATSGMSVNEVVAMFPTFAWDTSATPLGVES